MEISLFFIFRGNHVGTDGRRSLHGERNTIKIGILIGRAYVVAADIPKGEREEGDGSIFAGVVGEEGK